MFRLEIETDNAAFESFPEVEVARILREVADQIMESPPAAGLVKVIRDVNGNTVGQWSLTGDEA